MFQKDLVGKCLGRGFLPDDSLIIPGEPKLICKSLFDRCGQFRRCWLDTRTESTHDVAFAIQEELFKVPFDVAFGSRLGIDAGQIAIQRASLAFGVVVDVDLVKHIEGHLVLARAELLDLFVGAWLLTTELIAGDTDDGQTL